MEEKIMRHHTITHGRHLNGIYKTAGKITGKTGRVLAKSLKNVKSKTKHLSKNVDRIIVKNRYPTLVAAVVTGLGLGYFLKK